MKANCCYCVNSVGLLPTGREVNCVMKCQSWESV